MSTTCGTLAQMVEPNEEHLKLIQSVISRMASNAFILKGWAVTLVSGLAALAKADTNHGIAWIACGAAIVFAMLDAMYLANERAFRKLYDEAARGRVETWSLSRAPVTFRDFLSALVSWSVLPLYAMTAAGAAVVAAFI
jgi:hypothetical protein